MPAYYATSESSLCEPLLFAKSTERRMKLVKNL